MLVWPSVLVFVIGAASLIAGGILGWVVFPKVIEDQVIDNVKLTEGTDQYKRWEQLDFPVKFKVYIWEVLNPDEVITGAKPKLQEKGPYVYNQFPRKVDIKREGTNLTFREIEVYEFDKEDSAPLTEDDDITVFNLPYHAITQIAEEMGEFQITAINAASNLIFNGQGVFLKTKVKTFLFDGVPICINGRPALQCRSIASVPSPNIRKGEDGTLFFSLFEYKNNSDGGEFKIDSGESNVMDLGKILEWKGSDHLDAWKNNEDGSLSVCNMLNGTDGNIYPPFVKGRQSMQIFSLDICRSVTVHYTGEKKYMGINGLMYRTQEDMLPAPSLDDDTRCFCLAKTPGVLQDNGCLKKGALELYECLDSHMVLTMPHFLMADEAYVEGIQSGLNPDPEKHQIFILVEPNTGSPLAGEKRVQFNMFLRKVNKMVATENLKTTLFPVIWVDEGMELGEDMIQLLNDELMKPLKIVEAVKWTLVAVGILLVVVGAIWLIAAMRSRGKTV